MTSYQELTIEEAILNEEATPNKEFADFSPTLRGGGVTLDPISITRLNFILPFEMQTDQTLCGDTIVSNNGDYNVRVTMEGTIALSQLPQLFAIRAAPNDLTLNWSGNTVDGVSIGSVSFDRIEIERSDEDDVIEYDGGTVEPVYTFQIQSKEQTGDE